MTSDSITAWLRAPHLPVDGSDLEAVTRAYPYFVPARYMEAAVQHEARPFSAPMLSAMKLYMGNWLLFYQLMESARVKPAYVPPVPEPAAGPVTPVVAEPAPAIAEPVETEPVLPEQEETAPLIQPVFTEDYFRHQGLQVDDTIPLELDKAKTAPEEPEDPRSLMVVMSFAEWLMHYKTKSQKEKEEEEDRRALKSMWQQEKLAAALEEEHEEIPENVFEMAVNSITKEDDLISESLAEILVRQGKWQKAIDMYKKLGLRNPQKSAYFAQQIALIQKNHSEA